MYVRNGTYDENLYVNRDGLTLVGQSETGVRVTNTSTSNSKSLLYVNSPNVTVKRMTLSTDGDDGLFFASSATGGYASDITVSNISGYASVFLDSRTTLHDVRVNGGNSVGISIAETADGSVVEHSTLSQTGNAGIPITGDNVTVRDVQVTNAGGTAVFINASDATVVESELKSSKNGIFTGKVTDNVQVRQTVLVNNQDYGMFVRQNASTMSISDSAIYGNTDAAMYNGASSILEATRNYWGEANVTASCDPVDSRLQPSPSDINTSDPLCSAP